MKTLLVVGGAGFIGSHFCKVANKEFGYNIIVYDNLSTGKKEFTKWGKLIIGDLSNYDLIFQTIKKYNPIAVVHFAAFMQVGESVINPYKYYDNNVANTLNLLKAMNECSIKNIIFSSTAAIFGRPNTKFINENTIKSPINPYGRSKLMIEQILDDFDIAYGIKNICLRYFNASGADPACEIGEIHQPAIHLIPIILEKYKKKEILNIFGGDWNTKDGTCIRDYIHVYDLAIAHILALEKLIGNKQSMKINLGSGNGFSVLDIVKTTEKIINDKINYKIVDRREGDPEILVCDNQLALKYLNWKIKYKNVEDHILHQWNLVNKI